MILASAVCFGAIPILVTLGMRAGATLPALLFWRYAIGAVVLAALAGGPAAVVRPGRRAAGITLAAGAMQALVAFTSLSALRWIPAATLTFLFFTFPAWVTLLAALRGSEPLTARRVTALGLALAGIAAMVGTPGGARLGAAGIGLALLSALLYALYVPMIGRFQRGLEAALVGTYASAGAALAFAVALLARDPGAAVLPGLAWVHAAVLGLLSTAAGFILFLRGLAALGPVRTAILATAEPFCTTVLAAAVLGQAITGPTMIGGALIAAAVVVLQWRPEPRLRATD